MIRRLGIIGAGGMSDTVLSALSEALPAPLEAVSLLVRPGRQEEGTALLERFGDRLAMRRVVHDECGSFLADAPDLVAECAGHGAVGEHGEAVLSAGADLVIASTGAISDDGLHDRLKAAAERGGAQLILPAGAVGGIDALVAARLSGLEDVTYTGRKPPRAWRGTRAEALLDLDGLTEPATFFEGTAREAARDYPQNANVAATVALAGAGMDATRVRLIADPGIARNLHEVSVRSSAAEFTIRLEGRPSSANPKTSLTAGYSVAREVLNRVLPVVV
ncbi:aspartate dehydrogenase [Roseomonas xinghualingensis]|uniref:aspartate dehydrogenase n=1 Tax=Roseomonas xinghualingensis TaxID=2986475 RepID=UPI0021F20116|nr:aspartate dehydrogenase [Roseomonas sp. SXEYE001]MCV4209274.1 aspartate dehydrogenase [Roseomonas sp. SXEYE001]